MWNSILETIAELDIRDKALAYFTSSKFIVSIFLLLVAAFLLIIIRRSIAIFVKKKAALTGKPKKEVERIPTIVEKALTGVVLVIALLSIFQVNGINVTSLVASLGIVSAIVGLSLQDYLKDLIMGAHIFMDKFFTVGDVVRYKGTEGIVVSFTTKTTKIQSMSDFSIISVCNRNIDEIAKLGDFQKINIPLSYDEDVPKVHKVLGEITERIKQIEGVKSAVYKGTFEFQDSAILYRINYYVDPKDKWTVWYKVMKEVQDSLWAEGIKIPYNQLDVHNYTEK